MKFEDLCAQLSDSHYSAKSNELKVRGYKVIKDTGDTGEVGETRGIQWEITG